MNKNEIFTLIIGLGSPLLVFLGGLITWFIKTRSEELKAIEERAIEKRIEIYTIILDPLIVLLSKNTDKKIKESSIKKINSVEYKKASFNLITYGSDDLVISYNEMMQGFYKYESNKNPKETMKRFALFILAIRKDIYNKNTKLKEWDMLKFLITDIEKIM